jgi:hypothetical protein
MWDLIGSVVKSQELNVDASQGKGKSASYAAL